MQQEKGKIHVGCVELNGGNERVDIKARMNVLINQTY
jgi:hypothetical protein